MRRIIAVLILGVLISGCSSGIDKNKSENTSIDKSKFDNLYRSAKAIEGATAVGVSHGKFDELLQNFITEISIVKDKVGNRQEVALLQIYSDIFNIYQDSDSKNLWELDGSGGTVYNGDLLILDKYKIPTERFRSDGANVDAGAVRTIWGIAGERLKLANALLNNPNFGETAEEVLNQIRQPEKEATESSDTQQNQSTQSNTDPLAVSGIINGKEPSAVIGGSFLKLGDMVNGYKIIQIGSDYVEFVDKDGHALQRKIGQ